MEEFHGHGGSYTVDKYGNKVQTEAPTGDHPEGNRARDAEPSEPASSAKKPAIEKPAE